MAAAERAARTKVSLHFRWMRFEGSSSSAPTVSRAAGSSESIFKVNIHVTGHNRASSRRPDPRFPSESRIHRGAQIAQEKFGRLSRARWPVRRDPRSARFRNLPTRTDRRQELRKFTVSSRRSSFERSSIDRSSVDRRRRRQDVVRPPASVAARPGQLLLHLPAEQPAGQQQLACATHREGAGRQPR